MLFLNSRCVLQAPTPAVVYVTVLDVNDNSPEFSSQVYTAEVAEDVPVDWAVITVHATDRDQPGTKNSRISYTFEQGNDGNGSFYIEHATGEWLEDSNAIRDP